MRIPEDIGAERVILQSAVTLDFGPDSQRLPDHADAGGGGNTGPDR
jgi:hypothetical protein